MLILPILSSRPLNRLTRMEELKIHRITDFSDPYIIMRDLINNWIEGILEYASITRRAFEAIAELQKFELDYDLYLPEPTNQRIEELGLNKLMIDINRLPTSGSFEPWERELMYAIPRFLLNYARFRDWFERETLADIALFGFIANNDSSHDQGMVCLFHRRALRLSMIIAGTDPNHKNPQYRRLDPIL